MATLSSAGIGSGLDVSSIVSALVEAETLPVQSRLNQREARLQSEISAIGQVKSALSGFQSSLSSLQDLSGFQKRAVSISDQELFTATASEEADPGNYNVTVEQLAVAHSIASSGFADLDTVVGTGTLTIQLGTYDSDLNTFTANPDKAATDITISSNEQTLSGIRDAINAADAGVTAAIINDGSGERLVLSANDTGEVNSIQVTVSNDADLNDTDNAGLSQLAYDPTASVGSGKNLTQTIAAQDARVIISGITINSDSNTISDAIDGVTINLLTADAGKTATMAVTKDDGSITGKVNSFVAEFNELMSLLDTITSYDPETGAAGLLQGDSGINILKFQVRNLISEPVDNVSGSIRSLVDIGIKTQTDGSITVDSTILQNAIDNNFDEIGKLFAHGAFTSDEQVKVNSISDDTPTGVYNVNLSQYNPATQLLEGTIDGASATSSDGKFLQGTSALLGLKLEITGGSTGDRGTVTVVKGIASQLDDLIEQYLDSEGALQSRTDSLNNQLSEITDDRSALAIRTEALQARFLRQFTALDTLMTELQATSNFLTSQLSSISNISSGQQSSS